ncbi:MULTISPECIES: amidohydrolase family protein [unclassified Micromonospora]
MAEITRREAMRTMAFVGLAPAVAPSLFSVIDVDKQTTVVAPVRFEANLLEGDVKDVTVTMTEGTNMAADVSPDGTTIVFVLQTSLWSMPVGGGEARQLTGWQVEAVWPAWSPDGSRIAFQNYSDQNYQIWTMRPDGSDLVQVTSGPYDHREPAWSPDGRKIAFSSDRSGNGSYDIWTIDVQTRAYERRTSLTTNEHSPAWSPDGSRIAYVDGRFVYAVDAAGVRQELASIPSGSAQAPNWLPGGQGVVFLNNARQIVLDGQTVTSGEDIFPFPVRWLPDGRFLYAGDGKLRLRNADGSGLSDIAFSAQLSVQRPVIKPKDYRFGFKGARPTHGILAPALSPDGMKVAFVALNDLWVMEIGKKPVRLTDDKFLDWYPSWSRDGAKIYFGSDRHGGGSPELYSIELATRTITRLSFIPDHDVVGGVIAPDGRSFAFINDAQALLVYDFATRQSRLVVNRVGGGATVGRPSWSPDSATIALADFQRNNTRFREGRNLIRTIDVATGAASFQEPAPHPNGISDRVESGPAWSPDGKWMAFIMDSTLHVLPVDHKGVPTGPAVQLTQHAADMPAWGGDSRTIVYVSNDRLKTIRVDGTGERDIPLDLKWQQAVPAGRTVIHAGGMWDGINPIIHRDVEIMVVGNRIQTIGPIAPGAKGKALGLGKNDRFVDASNLVVMPGLWDSHIHTQMLESMGNVMAMFLSYGITSVSCVGWTPYHALNLRESLEAGKMVGPRLFTAGALADGLSTYYAQSRPIKDERVADLEMQKARILELDYLKAYVRTPVWLMAKVAKTAHEMGVPSGTHPLSPGIQTGLKGITHLSATQRSGFSPSLSPGGILYQDALALFTEGESDMASTNLAPALIGDDPMIVQDRRFQLLMPPQFVPAMLQAAQNPPTDAQRASIRTTFNALAAVLRAGTPFALGTDAPLNAPAVSLHLALRAMADVTSNHEALQTATANAARYMGVGHELGTLEEGKIADLAMVNGNPLEDVADAASVELVMKNGIVHSVGEILQPYATSAALQE